jgi:glycosyltransferase involved in cell wall biosynthesis
MKHIVHVVGSLAMGGAESRLVGSLKYVDYSAARITFLTFDRRPGPLEQLATARGASIATVPWTNNPVKMSKRLTEYLRNSSPDVLHAHLHYYSGICVFAAARARVPQRIVHFRVTNDAKGEQPSRRIYRWLMKYLITSCATDVVAVSRTAFDAALGPRRRSKCGAQVIHNGFDFKPIERTHSRGRLRAIGNLPEHAQVAMHVGRFELAKNHAAFTSIIAEMSVSHPHLYWVFVGDGSLKDAVKATLLRAGLHDRVRLLGVRRDVPELLPGADVFVFPSLYEGSPGALIEAVGSGLPAVASDIPEHRELAESVEGIRLVALGDCKGFACAVSASLAAPKWTTSPPRLAALFSMQSHLRELNRLYRSRVFQIPEDREVAGL